MYSRNIVYIRSLQVEQTFKNLKLHINKKMQLRYLLCVLFLMVLFYSTVTCRSPVDCNVVPCAIIKVKCSEGYVYVDGACRESFNESVSFKKVFK